MSLLYSNAALFQLAMAVAYGDHRHERFNEVARWIAPHSEVLDVCCGAGILANYLPVGTRYRGLDRSRHLVATARRRNLDVSEFDLRSQDLPQAPVIVCQISLYQFHPEESDLLARLFRAAQTRLIISESVRSLAQSKFAATRWLGTKALQVQGMTQADFRFTPERLQILFAPYRSWERHFGPICAGRDWLYVVDKPIDAVE
jgi:SAM-dependent methyltransferase